MASSLMIMNATINSTQNQLSTENMKKASNSNTNNHISEKISITNESINKNSESNQCLLKSIPVQNHSNFSVSRLSSASSLSNHSIIKNNLTNSASSSLSTVTSATTIQPLTNTTPLATPITQILNANSTTTSSNTVTNKASSNLANVNQYPGSIVTIISKNFDHNNKNKSPMNATNNSTNNNSTKITINESINLNKNPTDNSNRLLNRLSDESIIKNNINNNFNSQKNTKNQIHNVFVSTHELKIAKNSNNTSSTNDNNMNNDPVDETEISSVKIINSRDSTTKIKVKYNTPTSSALEMDDSNTNNNNNCINGNNSNGSSSPSTTSSPSESSNTSPVGSLSTSPIAEHLNHVHLMQTDFVQLKNELDSQYKNLVRPDEHLKLDHSQQPLSSHENKLALDSSDYMSVSDYSYIKSSTISRAPSSSTYMKPPITSAQSSHNKTKKRVSFNDCLVQVHLIPNVANMLNEKYKQAIDSYHQIEQLTDSADSTQSDEVDYKSSTETLLQSTTITKIDTTETGVQNTTASTTYSNNDQSNKYQNHHRNPQQSNNNKKSTRATSAFISNGHHPSVKLSISNLTLGTDQQAVDSEISETNNERPSKSYTFRKEMNPSRSFNLNDTGETTYVKLASNDKVANESSLPYTVKPAKNMTVQRVMSAAPASQLKQIQEANAVKLNSSSSFNPNDINPQLKFLSNLKKLKPSASLFSRSSSKSDFQVNGCKDLQANNKYSENNENNSSNLNLIAGTPFSLANFSKSSFKSSNPTKYVFLKPDDHVLNSFCRSHTIANMSNQNNNHLKAMNNFIINNSMSSNNNSNNNNQINAVSFDPNNVTKTGSESNGHKPSKNSTFNSANQMVALNDTNYYGSKINGKNQPVSHMNRSSARLHSKPSFGQVTAIKIRPNLNNESEFARTHSALPLLRNNLNKHSTHGPELTRSDLRTLNGVNGLSSFSFKLHPSNANLSRSKTFVYPNANIGKVDNRRVNENTVDKTSL